MTQAPLQVAAAIVTAVMRMATTMALVTMAVMTVFLSVA